MRLNKEHRKRSVPFNLNVPRCLNTGHLFYAIHLPSCLPCSFSLGKREHKEKEASKRMGRWMMGVKEAFPYKRKRVSLIIASPLSLPALRKDIARDRRAVTKAIIMGHLSLRLGLTLSLFPFPIKITAQSKGKRFLL